MTHELFLSIVFLIITGTKTYFGWSYGMAIGSIISHILAVIPLALTKPKQLDDGMEHSLTPRTVWEVSLQTVLLLYEVTWTETRVNLTYYFARVPVCCVQCHSFALKELKEKRIYICSRKCDAFFYLLFWDYCTSWCLLEELSKRHLLSRYKIAVINLCTQFK